MEGKGQIDTLLTSLSLFLFTCNLLLVHPHVPLPILFLPILFYSNKISQLQLRLVIVQDLFYVNVNINQAVFLQVSEFFLENIKYKHIEYKIIMKNI